MTVHSLPLTCDHSVVFGFTILFRSVFPLTSHLSYPPLSNVLHLIPGMMFLFVALICLSSAIIVSSVAHSHSHNHNHSHNHCHGSHTHVGRGIGLDLGLKGDDDVGRGLERVEGGDDCLYVPIGDESSPRTTTS